MANEEAKDPKAEAAAAGPVDPAATKAKAGKILLALFFVINLVFMGAGTVAVYYLKVVYHRPIITEEKESRELANDREIRDSNPVLFTFEPFTINLDGKPRNLVHANIQLEMLNEDGYEEAVELVPKERDEIVRIFNTKKYEDIETIQGKLFLKDQIMTSMNKLLKKGTVKEVYFGEFVVQRAM